MSDVTTSTTAQDTTNAASANQTPSGEAGNKLYPQGQQQPATNAAPPPAAPQEIKYDLKLPEGSSFDNEWLKDWTDYAQGKKLDPEIAQEFVNRESTMAKSFFEAQQKQQAETREKWATDAQADKEIGGEQFQASVNMAKEVLKKYGTEAFVKELETTGYGNHPEVIRIFAKIGKAMNAQPLVTAGTQPAAQKKSLEQVFYPNN